MELNSNGLAECGSQATIISCLILAPVTDALSVAWQNNTHDRFFIGVDACRENLRANSRSKLPNALFVIASAQSLPQELNGLASHITINFPWGSLLESLLSNEDSLMSRLIAITRPFASLDIRLNGEALLQQAGHWNQARIRSNVSWQMAGARNRAHGWTCPVCAFPSYMGKTSCLWT